MEQSTRQSIRTLAVVVAALASAACIRPGVQGSGNVVTEEREVSGFNEIVLGGTGRVEVEVTGTESLTIEAEDNIMPALETRVRNGSLRLDTNRSISPSEEIVYTITAASLDGLAISGSGVMNALGIDTTDFRAEISGSGDVTAEGTLTGRLTISISGSGEFDGESLTAPEGEVDVSGSGSAVVNVTDSLEVDVSGSGDVEYLGSPDIETSVTGSGEVVQRG
jgi:hypothetical protein